MILQEGDNIPPIPRLPEHGGCSAGLDPADTAVNKETGTRFAVCPNNCGWSFMLLAGEGEWSGKYIDPWYSLGNFNRQN